MGLSVRPCRAVSELVIPAYGRTGGGSSCDAAAKIAITETSCRAMTELYGYAAEISPR